MTSVMASVTASSWSSLESLETNGFANRTMTSVSTFGRSASGAADASSAGLGTIASSGICSAKMDPVSDDAVSAIMIEQAGVRRSRPPKTNLGWRLLRGPEA